MNVYYEDELATVHNGDALEVMDSLAPGSIDLIVTDPPYVIGAVSAGSLGSKSGGWADMMNSAMWFAAWYTKAARLLRHDGAMWSFCNWRSLPVVMRAASDAGLPITSTLVWDKQWIGPGGKQGLRPGSGTTLVAAKAEGVRCIGIEAEPKWCEVAARRLSVAPLFEMPKAKPAAHGQEEMDLEGGAA